MMRAGRVQYVPEFECNARDVRRKLERCVMQEKEMTEDTKKTKAK
jgi:hypothetical protein